VLFDDPHSVRVTRDILKKFSPEAIIVSSVLKKIPIHKLVMPKGVNYLPFTSETQVPIKNKYRSAFTLGSDRLAAAVGGFLRFHGKPVLVIDAGTCLKFNYVNRKGEYLGGSISPGVEMRFKALHNFTARLPLLEAGAYKPQLIGTDTTGSIKTGVMEGIFHEVKGVIESYRKKDKNLNVILTGGDAALFDKRLKTRIFADPYLILKGLNAILEYNKN
jgi:type III pantothenate kinase